MQAEVKELKAANAKLVEDMEALKKKCGEKTANQKAEALLEKAHATAKQAIAVAKGTNTSHVQKMESARSKVHARRKPPSCA